MQGVRAMPPEKFCKKINVEISYFFLHFYKLTVSFAVFARHDKAL